MKAKNLKKITSLLMAMAIAASLGGVVPASAADVSSAEPTSVAPYDIEAIKALPETHYEASPVEGVTTPTGHDSTDLMARASNVDVLKGTATYVDTNAGSYYYAYSPGTSTYVGAFANIQLPLSFNAAGTAAQPKRHGFISLGIHGGGMGSSYYAVDLGLGNFGNGWKAVYYDTKSRYTGYQDSSAVQAFQNYVIPSNATNVIIMVNPVSDGGNTSYDIVELYLQPCIGVDPVGSYFKQQIKVSDGIVGPTNRYYRFASLIPANSSIPNNMSDGAYMRGGAFTNCQLYDKNYTYYAWGIPTNLVQNAWIVNPSHMSLSRTEYNDAFNIFYT